MASPLPTAKQSVNLAASDARNATRGSRIRRDPPPPAPVKQLSVRDTSEREAWSVVIGMLTFVIALMAVLAGLALYGGWSPGAYKIVVDLSS